MTQFIKEIKIENFRTISDMQNKLIHMERSQMQNMQSRNNNNNKGNNNPWSIRNPSNDQRPVHSRVIWQVMWISIDVGGVARLVIINHNFLIGRINKKQMKIKDGFLSEKYSMLSRI